MASFGSVNSFQNTPLKVGILTLVGLKVISDVEGWLNGLCTRAVLNEHWSLWATALPPTPRLCSRLLVMLIVFGDIDLDEQIPPLIFDKYRKAYIHTHTHTTHTVTFLHTRGRNRERNAFHNISLIHAVG